MGAEGIFTPRDVYNAGWSGLDSPESANAAIAVLEDAGSAWERIVDVTVFLTNLKEDFAAYNRVYAQYFAGNRPTRTTVEVSRLPTPIAIELKVIAVVPEAEG